MFLSETSLHLPDCTVYTLDQALVVCYGLNMHKYAQCYKIIYLDQLLKLVSTRTNFRSFHGNVPTAASVRS